MKNAIKFIIGFYYFIKCRLGWHTPDRELVMLDRRLWFIIECKHCRMLIDYELTNINQKTNIHTDTE